ncbi:hypothetical protein K439DRAFT_1656239 [Ramaria rubella]|nr:hypothetical protein K439DRAFT_1656239 [Ramaria rubella]
MFENFGHILNSLRVVLFICVSTMKLAWISAFVVGIVSASAASFGNSELRARSIASIKENCASGDIISTSTIQANGNEVNITTRSCATSSKATTPLAARASKVVKRQNICGSGADCNVDCDVATGMAPFASDCQNIINALEDQQPNMFTEPALSFSEVTSISCGFKIFNLQDIAVVTCLTDLALGFSFVTSDCFPSFDSPQASSDGFCIPDDEAWAIEGFLVAV